MELPPPNFQRDIEEIVAVNRAWKASQELIGLETNMTRSFRDLKGYLQVKLLKQYSPTWVYLEIDEQADSDEPLYGLKLVHQIGDYTNAEHLPIRVAQAVFTLDEIQRFTKE